MRTLSQPVRSWLSIMSDHGRRDANLLRVCALAALLFLAVVEVIAGRSELAGRLVPGSGLGILLQTEEKIIRPNEHPALIILGTSRGRGAFLPTVVESTLGLRRGDVLNLAMGGTNIYDALLTYSRSRNELRGAAVVIVQVDPFQFNVGRPPSELLRRYADWRQRRAYDETRHRWPLRRDYFFSAAVALGPLGFYAGHLLTEGRAPPQDSVDRFGRLAVVRIANDHDPAEFRQQRLRYWLDWQYRDYSHSPTLEQVLVRLADMAHEDGAKVYLVVLPTVARYRQMLLDYPGHPDGVFRARLSEALGRHVDGIGYWGLPGEAGLEPTHFRDWGHLNTAGAVAWSDFFSRWLEHEEKALIASRRKPLNHAAAELSLDSLLNLDGPRVRLP